MSASRLGWASAVVAIGAIALSACSGSTAPTTTPTPLPTVTVSTPSSTAIPTIAPEPVETLPPSSATSTAAPKPTSTSTPAPTSTTTTSAPQPTATCTIPSSLLGRDLTKVPTTSKVVALTFDAGGDNSGVASILQTLSATRVKATFFLTGRFATAFPSSSRAMAAYPVGNHTQNHPDLTTLSDSQIRTEIRTAAANIKAATGQNPQPYFRFPFGAVDSHVIGVVNAECYVPFRWTVDTLGWKGTSGGQSVDSVVKRVLDAATPGEIVLMHVGANPDDGSTLDADALPRIISGLRAKGYGFVTLEAVLPAS
jgi:peptidoglycan/xylan/chitin deacetylase (PgdA/CDA1 family)